MAAEQFIGNLSGLAGEQTGSIVSNAFGLLQNVPGFDLVIRLFQVAGALFIVYLVFLIMKAFAGLRSARKLSIIAKNVEEINSKLDLLVGKRVSKKEKK